jgi:hypothetical protein
MNERTVNLRTNGSKRRTNGGVERETMNKRWIGNRNGDKRCVTVNERWTRDSNGDERCETVAKIRKRNRFDKNGQIDV